jgi:hypothetical protein
MPRQTNPNATPATPSTGAPWYTIVVAIAILVGFGFMCVFMLEKAGVIHDDDQIHWERMVLVFNSIQTLAAAAAGVLLGTSVQMARVASAEGRAQANEADAAKADAARRALRNLQPPGAPAQGSDETLRALQAVLN